MCIPTTQGEDPLLSSAVWSHCFMSRGSGIILGTGPGCPESCEYPIPGGAQGQAVRGLGQPDLVGFEVHSNLSYSMIPSSLTSSPPAVAHTAWMPTRCSAPTTDPSKPWMRLRHRGDTAEQRAEGLEALRLLEDEELSLVVNQTQHLLLGSQPAQHPAAWPRCTQSPAPGAEEEGLCG